MFIFCFLLVACNNCDCYKHNRETAENKPISNLALNISEIHAPHVRRHVQAHHPNAYYGFHLLKKDGIHFFTYVTDSSTLELVHLADSTISYSINIKPLLSAERYAGLSITGDTVCIFQPKTRMMSIFSLTMNYAQGNVQTTKLNIPEKTAGSFYLMSNPGFKSIFLHYPYLLIPYGYTSRKNYIDSTAYLLYNLNSNASSKIVRYPSCYENCGVYDYQASIAVKNNALYCIFKKHDNIYRFSLNGDLIDGNQIIHDCRLEEFDNAKAKDLAYVRKHQLLGESNLQLLADDRANLLLIKQSKVDSLNAKRVYEAYVINNQLKQSVSFRFSEPIHPYAMMNYSGGFLVFTERLDKAYHYAVQNQ